MSRERIIFLSSKNPFSKKDWSGIPYFMMQALQNEFEVDYITSPAFTAVKTIGYYFGRLLDFMTGRKYVFDYGLVMAWCYGWYYSRHLKNKQGYKFIFIPAGLTEIAFLNTSIPIISFGDCSVVQLFNYYPSLMTVSLLSTREINYVERRALNKVTMTFFSSSWASSFISSHYNTQAAITIPFGANITNHSEVKRKRINHGVCNLLFVGVDWERKGGDVTIEILKTLLERRIKTHLTIVGCSPPHDLDLRNIQVIEKLDKDSLQGEEEFKSLLNQSDFFILPTRADCTPIVIAEAFSAGLPVLASKTGGIPSLVTEGVNGYLFAQDDVQGYVDRIIQLLESPSDYECISQQCIQSYLHTFNWQQWAEVLKRSVSSQLH